METTTRTIFVDRQSGKEIPQFDFNSYNTLMRGVGTGLKLHLGIQLIRNVTQSLDYFDNPLASEIGVISSDLKEFHVKYKEASKRIQAERDAKTAGSKAIDNSTVPTVGVQDMMAMFQTFQAMMAASKAGNEVAAHIAATSTEQIANGVLHATGDPQQQAA